MLGTKIEKKNIDYRKYSQIAGWCNENDVSIADRGDYYEVVEIPTLLAAEKIAILDKEYSEKIGNMEIEMAKAKAIEDEELYADLKTEREELISEYTKKRSEI